MTDTPSLPPPESPEPFIEPVRQDPPPRPRRDPVPWLYALGFLVLAGAIAYLWQNPGQPTAPATPPPEMADLQQQMQQQIQTLTDRVAKLEQQPQPKPVDLGPLQARVAALEKGQQADLGPLMNRVAALEQRPSMDASVPGRVDAMSGRIEALSGRLEKAVSDLTQRIDAQGKQLAAQEHTADKIAALAERNERLARIQAASAALAAGQPLGDVPNAPPALARFAHADPPTEAKLRLAYPKAERAALAASEPDTGDKPFLARVKARAEELVTVRQGDHVIVGGAAAGILARTRAALDAGDLAGAVAAASTLTGAPAEAMQPWLSDAKALLAARDALATMAEHA
jgi:hypothetical protein